MKYPDDVVAAALERMGRSDDAKFLRQRLMRVLLDEVSSNAELGALKLLQGRRLLARELLNDLGLTDERPGNSDAELVKRSGPVGASSGASSGAGRWRVPAVAPDDKPDAG